MGLLVWLISVLILIISIYQILNKNIEDNIGLIKIGTIAMFIGQFLIFVVLVNLN